MSRHKESESQRAKPGRIFKGEANYSKNDVWLLMGGPGFSGSALGTKKRKVGGREAGRKQEDKQEKEKEGKILTFFRCLRSFSPLQHVRRRHNLYSGPPGCRKIQRALFSYRLRKFSYFRRLCESRLWKCFAVYDDHPGGKRCC